VPSARVATSGRVKSTPPIWIALGPQASIKSGGASSARSTKATRAPARVAAWAVAAPNTPNAPVITTAFRARLVMDASLRLSTQRPANRGSRLSEKAATASE
jgi:hypothetical protein